MQRFHIDPAGNPGKCRARTKCPWGDLQNDHYPSERAARKAYELENTYEIRDIPAAMGESLMAIGPRQLPNRMWIKLRNAIIDRHWSSYELELAEVVFKEEQESINRRLAREPKENWSSEEQDAEGILPFIVEARIAMNHENSSRRSAIRAQLEKEFPEDY